MDDISSVIPESANDFDFTQLCFFCGKKCVGSRNKNQWCIVKQNFILDKIIVDAIARDDDLAATILHRLDGITSLVDATARYHIKCYKNFWRIQPAQEPSVRAILNNASFDKVCNYIEESGKFEFTMSELEDVMKPDCLDRRTLCAKLVEKYDKYIYIHRQQGKPAMIHYKSFDIGNMCNKFYWEDNWDEHEKEIILKTAAQLLIKDVMAKEYNVESYPPPATFLEDVDNDVPDLLTSFMKALIENDEGRDHQRHYTRRQTISHTIISAIRPRQFMSKLQLAVGTYFYNKTGSKKIIQLLEQMGVSVSYHNLQEFEASVISNPPAVNFGDKVHLQHVFANTDHNVNSSEGHHTFHCMGGLAIYTPVRGVSHGGRVDRNEGTSATTSAVIRAKGGIPSIPYCSYNSKGLEELVYQDTNTLRLGVVPLLPPSYSVYIWAKFFKIPQLPSWSGFMEILSGETSYSASRIVCEPFINEPPANNTTINTALNFARSECDKLNQKTCFVTFDQPLYDKARTIIAECQEHGKLRNVVAILGGYHLLMSYLGAIGYIMADSGLEALWSTVFAPESVGKMMSGHPFNRAMRAHILTYTALGITIAKTSTSDKTAEYENHVTSFLKDWNLEPAHPLTTVDCQCDPVIAEMTSELVAETNRLRNNGPTAQLWIQYFELVSVALQFVEAQRLGNWKLHLQCVKQMLPVFHAAGHLLYAKSTQIYLQDMASLGYTMDHEEYEQFTAQGFFTVRRSDKAWSGVWTDMTIEQTLNKYLRTDLIHAGGITAKSIERHLLAIPSTYNIMKCLEEFFNIQTISSDQHSDLGESCQKQDEDDLNKFLSWIHNHEPLQARVTLQSLSTGMYGTDIDCHLAIAKGRKAMLSMLGKNAKNLSLSMVNKVKNLASLKANLHLAATPHLLVDPALLLQRITVVLRGDPAKMQNALNYELAPYPLTLFDEKGFMRKSPKGELYKLFKTHKSDIPTEEYLESFVYILDGDFLLQSVSWPHGVTYHEIFKRYHTFIINHYRNNACVVFDGYDDEFAGTKSYERYRRGETNFMANADFTQDMLIALSQKKFLSNTKNKRRFIDLLGKFLRDNSIRVEIAAKDVDRLVVNTAINMNNSIEGPVAVVGNDTDLLVLLIALNRNQQKPIYFLKVVPGVTKDLYSTEDQKDFKEFLLFAHAFTGCGTTSSIYMKGKKTLLIHLQKNKKLRNLAKIFYDHESLHMEICSAAEMVVLHLYGYNILSDESLKISLAEARYEKFVATAALGCSTIRLAKLPPTAAAVHQHAKRAYLQIQTWMGQILMPENFGWKRHSNMLHPIMTTENPASEELLKLISCDCTTDCHSTGCGCAKAEIRCSELCKHCNGVSCKNSSVISRQVSLEQNDETADDIDQTDSDDSIIVKDEINIEQDSNITDEGDE